ncbi:TPA: TetR/AcrR family transcriptional regulator [Streptococcus agalactiae]|nr:putative transcriptional regulator TetR/AcrR family [Finegoldia magna ATCC 29328]
MEVIYEMKMEADERKKQIRQAAIKVFLDKGFRNTVMNDIMEATGLSRGGLYHHYGSTHEILYDIMLEGNKYREKIIYDEMNKTSQDFSEVLSEIILEKMLYQSDYVSIYAMFLQELNHDDKLKDLYKKLKKSSSDSILMLFDEDVRGELSEAIELITDFINTFILGCEVLNARENFVKNKLALKKMIGIILDNNAK